MNYYNEFDPNAAQWLRDLITAGLIPDGDVDERSIEDVTPADLHGYTQCHFFAGIGGWVHALDLAGWPRDRPVWTGSCPCQPFSAAGKGDGFADERHLWPAFQHLIAQCRPATVFGEQVASKAVDAWIDLVQADLEGMGYAFGSVPFPAASVGAPHIRDRNYWCATTGVVDHAHVARLEGHARHGGAAGRQGPGGPNAQASLFGGLADPDGGNAGTERQQRGWQQRQQPQDGVAVIGLADSDQHGRTEAPVAGLHDAEHHPESRSGNGELGDALRGGLEEGVGQPAEGRQRRPKVGASFAGSDGWLADTGRRTVQRGTGHGGDGSPPGTAQGEARERQRCGDDDRIGGASGRPGPTAGFWRAADWIFCRDDKWRPVEPGTFPLAFGLPAGMGSLSPGLRSLAEVAGLDQQSLKLAKAYRNESLRGYGNAIVPEQAGAFVEAFMDAVP